VEEVLSQKNLRHCKYHGGFISTFPVLSLNGRKVNLTFYLINLKKNCIKTELLLISFMTPPPFPRKTTLPPSYFDHMIVYLFIDMSTFTGISAYHPIVYKSK
jgi:hypothetical protein